MAADGAVITAGTFVCSVLETAGLMVQARFLALFKDFFREAGAFIYVIAACGAVFSFALYGSYRAGRYLLVGPAIFFFLVGPRFQTSGAVWQLGGGEIRGQDGRAGIDRAFADRDKLIGDVAGVEVRGAARLSREGPQKPGEPFEISRAFALFALPINEVVRDFVDLLLSEENGKDLLFFGRTRGLEILTTLAPNGPGASQFIEMLEGNFLLECYQMVGYGAAQIAPDYREQVRGIIDDPANGNAKAREFFKTLFEEHSKRVVPATPATRERIRSRAAQPNPGISAQLIVNGQPLEQLTCGQLWTLLSEFAFELARHSQDNVLQRAVGDMPDSPQSRDVACREIERVIYGRERPATGGPPCDLAAAIALYLLRNQIFREDTNQRILERHWNRANPGNPCQDGLVVPRDVLSLQGGTWEPVMENGRVKTVEHTVNGQKVVMHMYRRKADGPPNAGQSPQARLEQWFPAVSLSSLQAPTHAMWVATQRYNTVNLRQQLFTWALQIPYWQGMMLFFIATAYPFIALIVLIPGRARGILNVPLAWLWIKSWDAGFAFVMILEKILYAIFPRHDFPEHLRVGPWTEQVVPDVLYHALRYDPSYNIHMYYMLLSMALFMVPPVTGLMTVHTKRALVASFTDAAASFAKDAGSRAAGMYGMDVMTDMIQLQRGLKYAAMMDAVTEGKMDPMSLALARVWGTLAATSQLSVAGGKGLHQGGKAAAVESARAGEVYHATASKILQAELRHDAAFKAAFDPVLGRWGVLAIQLDAYAAAMDGGGGFEINDPRANATAELRDLFLTKVATLGEILQRLARAWAHIAAMVQDGAGMKEGPPVLAPLMVLLALRDENLRRELEHGGANRGDPELPQLRGPLLTGPSEGQIPALAEVKRLYGVPDVSDEVFIDRVFMIPPPRETGGPGAGAARDVPVQRPARPDVEQPARPQAPAPQLMFFTPPAADDERRRPPAGGLAGGGLRDGGNAGWLDAMRVIEAFAATSPASSIRRTLADGAREIFALLNADDASLSRERSREGIEPDRIDPFATTEVRTTANEPQLGQLPLDIELEQSRNPALAAELLDRWVREWNEERKQNQHFELARARLGSRREDFDDPWSAMFRRRKLKQMEAEDVGDGFEVA